MKIVNNSRCSKCQKIAHISELERCIQENKLECIDKNGCLKRVLDKATLNKIQQNAQEKIETNK